MDIDFVNKRIIKIVKNIFVQKVKINPNSNLPDLGIDSVVLVQIVISIENEFNIIFDDDDLNLNVFRTVNNLSEYVLNKCNKDSFRKNQGIIFK